MFKIFKLVTNEPKAPLGIITPLHWRGRFVGSRRRIDAHILDGRNSSLGGAGCDAPPSSRGVPRPFAFSIPRFSRRCLSNAGVKRGTLFNSDWFTRRRFYFSGSKLYGHLPCNRNAMVVDGPRGTTRTAGGYRDFLPGPLYQTGKESPQGTRSGLISQPSLPGPE